MLHGCGQTRAAILSFWMALPPGPTSCFSHWSTRIIIRSIKPSLRLQCPTRSPPKTVANTSPQDPKLNRSKRGVRKRVALALFTFFAASGVFVSTASARGGAIMSPSRNASVSRWHNHCRNTLDLQRLRRKQSGVWPSSIIRRGASQNIQFMVKDSRKYAATGGWGVADFNDGKASDEAKHKTCFPCHNLAKAHDFVFTHYTRTCVHPCQFVEPKLSRTLAKSGPSTLHTELMNPSDSRSGSVT